MKVAVMGTGAIGGYIGARLAAVGAQVTFIARGAHLAAIRTAGVRVLSPLGDVTVAPASASDDPRTVGPVDVVLLGTKLYDVEATAHAIGPMVHDDTAVICLQNGVDAPAIVERRHGAAHVVPSVVMINGEVAGPGLIKHNAMNTLTVGELDGRASRRLDRFVAMANAAGIDTRLSEEIRLEVWRKFLMLAPMAAISGMTRLPLARIRSEPETWRLAELGMREVVAVANAEGVRLTEQDVQETLAFVMSMPETWKASLTVDLEQGRRLEVDWFSGTVCRLGEAAKIATPFHRVALGVLKPYANGVPH